MVLDFNMNYNSSWLMIRNLITFSNKCVSVSVWSTFINMDLNCLFFFCWFLSFSLEVTITALISMCAHHNLISSNYCFHSSSIPAYTFCVLIGIFCSTSFTSFAASKSSNLKALFISRINIIECNIQIMIDWFSLFLTSASPPRFPPMKRSKMLAQPSPARFFRPSSP